MDSPSLPATTKKKTGVLHKNWLKVRKAVQYVTLALFIGFLLLNRFRTNGAELIDYFMRLDPLITLGSLLSSRAFLAASAIGLSIALFLAILAGRAWCGWLCPLGTLLDIFQPKRSLAHKMPEELRLIKYELLLVVLTAALLGNLTLLALDPLTLFYRFLTVSFLPALDWIITALEQALYPFEIFQAPISTLERLLRPAVLPVMPAYFNQGVLFALIFVGVIALNFLAPRFWCRYLCPLGAFLGLVARIAVFKRQVKPGCHNCTLCSRRCPTGTINPEEGYASDPAECTLCLECFKNCPSAVIQASKPGFVTTRKIYNPSRRRLITSAAATVGAVALLRSGVLQSHPTPFLLRPPGAGDEDLLSACVRCGICLRICPTHALQPSGFENGLERFATPVIIPELGYCDFACNACGQACPTQAIPLLPLAEKQNTVIGKAYINQNRCLAWSDHRDCIVCEEMCPVPQKAIQLTEIEVTGESGETRLIKVPHVERERCIGCGLCEHKCPLPGEAAIRVYVSEAMLF